MKITKSELKGLIKECLREELSKNSSDISEAAKNNDEAFHVVYFDRESGGGEQGGPAYVSLEKWTRDKILNAINAPKTADIIDAFEDYVNKTGGTDFVELRSIDGKHLAGDDPSEWPHYIEVMIKRNRPFKAELIEDEEE